MIDCGYISIFMDPYVVQYYWCKCSYVHRLIELQYGFMYNTVQGLYSVQNLCHKQQLTKLLNF